MERFEKTKETDGNQQKTPDAGIAFMQILERFIRQRRVYSVIPNSHQRKKLQKAICKK